MKALWKIDEVSVKVKYIKCIFRVKSRKLLGFAISNGGIEDPDNVKAIQTMPTHETKKKMRSVLCKPLDQIVKQPLTKIITIQKAENQVERTLI